MASSTFMFPPASSSTTTTTTTTTTTATSTANAGSGASNVLSMLSGASNHSTSGGTTSTTSTTTTAASSSMISQRLQVLLARPENQRCCDCSDKKPTWATLIKPPPGSPPQARTIGGFCCFKCSAPHMRLGNDISFVKSTKVNDWKEEELVAMDLGGNKVINLIYEAKLNEMLKLQKPFPSSEVDQRDRYIVRKYEEREFFDQSIYLCVVAAMDPTTELYAAATRSGTMSTLTATAAAAASSTTGTNTTTTKMTTANPSRSSQFLSDLKDLSMSPSPAKGAYHEDGGLAGFQFTKGNAMDPNRFAGFIPQNGGMKLKSCVNEKTSFAKATSTQELRMNSPLMMRGTATATSTAGGMNKKVSFTKNLTFHGIPKGGGNTNATWDQQGQSKGNATWDLGGNQYRQQASQANPFLANMYNLNLNSNGSNGMQPPMPALSTSSANLLASKMISSMSPEARESMIQTLLVQDMLQKQTGANAASLLASNGSNNNNPLLQNRNHRELSSHSAATGSGGSNNHFSNPSSSVGRTSGRVDIDAMLSSRLGGGRGERGGRGGLTSTSMKTSQSLGTFHNHHHHHHHSPTPLSKVMSGEFLSVNQEDPMRHDMFLSKGTMPLNDAQNGSIRNRSSHMKASGSLQKMPSTVSESRHSRRSSNRPKSSSRDNDDNDDGIDIDDMLNAKLKGGRGDSSSSSSKPSTGIIRASRSHGALLSRDVKNSPHHRDLDRKSRRNKPDGISGGGNRSPRIGGTSPLARSKRASTRRSLSPKMSSSKPNRASTLDVSLMNNNNSEFGGDGDSSRNSLSMEEELIQLIGGRDSNENGDGVGANGTDNNSGRRDNKEESIDSRRHAASDHTSRGRRTNEKEDNEGTNRRHRSRSSSRHGRSRRSGAKSRDDDANGNSKTRSSRRRRSASHDDLENNSQSDGSSRKSGNPEDDDHHQSRHRSSSRRRSAKHNDMGNNSSHHKTSRRGDNAEDDNHSKTRSSRRRRSFSQEEKDNASDGSSGRGNNDDYENCHQPGSSRRRRSASHDELENNSNHRTSRRSGDSEDDYNSKPRSSHRQRSASQDEWENSNEKSSRRRNSVGRSDDEEEEESNANNGLSRRRYSGNHVDDDIEYSPVESRKSIREASVARARALRARARAGDLVTGSAHDANTRLSRTLGPSNRLSDSRGHEPSIQARSRSRAGVNDELGGARSSHERNTLSSRRQNRGRQSMIEDTTLSPRFRGRSAGRLEIRRGGYRASQVLSRPIGLADCPFSNVQPNRRAMDDSCVDDARNRLNNDRWNSDDMSKSCHGRSKASNRYCAKRDKNVNLAVGSKLAEALKGKYQDDETEETAISNGSLSSGDLVADVVVNPPAPPAVAGKSYAC